MDSESRSAMILELTATGTGAIGLIAVWCLWLSIFEDSPIIYCFLGFLLIAYFVFLEKRQFVSPVPTKIFAWRALTDLIHFIVALVALGPLLQIWYRGRVPLATFLYIIITIAVSSVIAIIRCTVLTMILIHRFTTSRNANVPQPPRQQIVPANLND